MQSVASRWDEVDCDAAVATASAAGVVKLKDLGQRVTIGLLCHKFH